MATWMKVVAVLAALLQLSVALATPTAPGIKEDFDAWRVEYKKEYATAEEYNRRLKIFADNALFVSEFNGQGHSYELELNVFADLTFEEFRDTYLTAPQDCSATRRGVQRGGGTRDQPTAIDWRDKGVVTPVKNQGSCGSCWTFSTTGCLESHHALKTGNLISLSEQQLVDCAQNFNNHGCDGGLPSQAFEYIHYNGGLESEEDYPYRGQDEKCRFNASKVVATVSQVHNISQGDEDGIYVAVGTVGPVSIAFDVTMGFQLYKKGVYSSILCSKNPDHVNHAVLTVGYNVTESSEPYWIVKNSWGADWGISGYFWIERGKNMCGLADCASYPIV